MRTEIVTSSDALRGLADDWQRLADVARGPSGASPVWCLPWLRHLGRGVPLVLAAHDGCDLVALVALQERRMCGLRVARFIGHELGVVSEMLVSPGHQHAATSLWDALLTPRRGLRHVELGHYRDGGSTLDAMRSVSPTIVEPHDTCWTLPVPSSLDRYLGQLPKGLRRTLRRADERLAEEGFRHAVEVVTDPARAAQVLPEVIEVCDHAERERPRQHLLAGQWAPFTLGLIRAAADSGRLRLFVGRIDSTPVSFDLGLITGNRVELWLGRYAPAWSRFSPGHLSMRAVVRDAVDSGVDDIDLGLGDDPYKRAWCPDRYATSAVSAGSSAAALRLGRSLLGFRRHLWERRAAARSRLGKVHR